MKNISTPPQLPTFTVLTLLDLHGLSYGQLAQLLKVSRQAIAQAVKEINDSSRIRGGVAKQLIEVKKMQTMPVATVSCRMPTRKTTKSPFRINQTGFRFFKFIAIHIIFLPEN
jgi:predicted DNA-binding protein (UPF0251 family)